MTKDKPTDGMENGLSTTRRGALAGAAGAGLLAVLGGSVQGDTGGGGGPAADELAHLLSRSYEGPASELPDAGVEGRRYFVTDGDEPGFEQWDVLRDNGESWERMDLGVGSVNAERLNNSVRYVRTKSELQSLFSSDAFSEDDNLSPGDTVIIDPDNAPIRNDQSELGITTPGVTVYGQYKYGSEFELKPADDTPAKGFLIEADDVTIEGISYHGNKDNQTHGERMPFVEIANRNNIHIGFNYGQNFYPYHEHNAGGDMIRSAGFADPNGVFGYFNKCVNTGDRMWTMLNGRNVYLYGEQAEDGFDRAFTFTGVRDGGAAFCRADTNVEGSAFGIQASGSYPSENVTLLACEGKNHARAFATVRDDAHPVNNVTIAFCHGQQDPESSETRSAVEFVGSGAGHSVIGGHYEGYEGAGVLNDMADVTVTGGARFEDITGPVLSGGRTEDFYDVNGGIDFDARNISWANVGDVVDGWDTATRPRWDGAIGGGVFGGVDLATTTPQNDGDEAVSDGTSSTAYLAARADTANTQWVVSDGTTVQY